MRENLHQQFSHQLRTRQIIFLSQLLSLAAYTFLGIYLAKVGRVGPERTLAEPGRYQWARIFFALLSAISIAASGSLRRRLKASAGDILVRLRALFKADLITWGLCEAVGIWGLIVFLLFGNLYDLFAFIALSALAMLYYRPTLPSLEELPKEEEERDGL